MFGWLKRIFGGGGSLEPGGRSRQSPGLAPGAQPADSKPRPAPEARPGDVQAQPAAPKAKPSGRIVAIDCETTGMAAYDRIVTLGLVHGEGLIATGFGVHLIFNPERRCHPKASAVHGWTDRVLRHQERFSDYASRIREEIGDGMLIAHNLSFDLRFLNAEMERANVAPIRNAGFCTMMAARDYWPGERASLDACLERIGLGRSGSHHGAMEDAALALSLYGYFQGGKDFLEIKDLSGPLNLVDPSSLPVTNQDLADALADSVTGIGAGLALRLVEAGYRTIEDLKSAQDADLRLVKGLGPQKIAAIRDACESYR